MKYCFYVFYVPDRVGRKENISQFVVLELVKVRKITTCSQRNLEVLIFIVVLCSGDFFFSNHIRIVTKAQC